MLKQGTTPFSGGQCSAHPFHRNQLWIIPPTCDPRFSPTLVCGLVGRAHNKPFKIFYSLK